MFAVLQILVSLSSYQTIPSPSNFFSASPKLNDYGTLLPVDVHFLAASSLSFQVSLAKSDMDLNSGPFTANLFANLNWNHKI